ncbi:GTP 3',8-cyclase MoaA [Arenicella xantha]|uniref:GTP 3',8-cyclase n=1 Tax=Arenicella xantha TaxID=644221 RepID=A0A395JM61_9GAMM|nr:GTP 3',8-cyclase MoaA [Arenicella xantha]RBP52700.1 cyclic pyranopterin monophosphate synthase subunit MoaA [Arenicella xantha]
MSEGQLVDGFGRTVRYLRLSVTDRCNLRCTYCMAEDMTFLPKSRVLSLEEMALVSQAFVALGVEKIRLTGGEPLVRNGLLTLAQNLSKLDGLRELVMTTNGVLLDQYAVPLRDAGVSRINISIDSLRAERFTTLTRFGQLDDVLRGIQAARQASFEKIKLNVVVLKGTNDDEVVELTQFAVDNGLDIAFIEEMPLGEISSHDRVDTALDNASVRQQLAEHFCLQASNYKDAASGPARYLQIADSDTKVGFISPMSDNFCSSCNRVRVTAEGQLLLCLGNEHSLDLRAIVRDNPDELQSAIMQAMQRKPEKHTFDPNDITIMRHMSATGG